MRPCFKLLLFYFLFGGDDTDIEDVKSSYEKTKAALYKVAPFFHSLLSRVRVVVSTGISTAAVDQYNTLYINPSFWEELDYSGRAFVVCHETAHIAFLDIFRLKDKDEAVWTVACDAINNNLISSFLKPVENGISMDFVARILGDDLTSIPNYKAISKEKLYELLKNDKQQYMEMVKLIKDSASDSGNPSIGRDMLKKPVDGEVIQDMCPELESCSNPEERIEKWKENVSLASTIQKNAGNMPGDLSRFIDKLLGIKVNWRNVLMRSIRDGIGRMIVQTWKRESRKFDGLPGIKYQRYPTLWALIDNSGSIDNNMFTKFISTVVSACGSTKVMAVTWDTRVTDVVEIKTKKDALNKNFSGLGGTCIRPALEYICNNASRGDIVLLLSDFFIYDIDRTETINLIRKVRKMFHPIVVCYGNQSIPDTFAGWRRIYIS